MILKACGAIQRKLTAPQAMKTQNTPAIPPQKWDC
jgi:hypothetical protein